MSDNLSREEAIFHAAAELTADERARFIAQECHGDEALAARIAALFAADASTAFMVGPALGSSIPGPEPERTAGHRIGRYRILQKIGEGGCGIVYMAEQAEPIRRRVALKIIKRGMDTRDVIARFESERQALALMQHPNIAQVFDAGETVEGRPYFVMELIRGQRITTYCDENQVPTSDRLKLFAAVCRAVQHAHEKGVIHRDLKPSNILVTLENGEPTPKIIDFGIAKAIAGKLSEATVITAFEQFIGTPAYMSPEQAEYTADEVDERSDVYSLGILLYELLTGEPPFDPKELARSGLEAVRRVIRETEPPKPSSRLKTLTPAALTTTATLRGTIGPKLVQLVHGDLDWIVLKTIEKDRTRRYVSAAALAEDVGRFLDDRPVAAHRPSQLYRWRKYVRRNRRIIATATAMLVVGAAASAVYSRRLAPAATAAATEEVGVFGDVDAMAFRGNESFSAKVLRDALATDTAFLTAAHSHARLQAMMETTRKRIADAYHAQGFTEATVDTRLNRSEQRIEVSIHEGQRHQRGAISISGNEKVPTRDLLEALTQAPSEDALDDAIRAIARLDRRPASLNPPGEPLFTHVSTFTSPAWPVANPAPIRAGDRANVVESVLRCYESHGYPFATVDVSFVQKPEEQRVGLQVAIHEGPAAYVGTLRVHGANRNTEAAILRCAGLSPGMRLDGEAIVRARANLWSSARFYGFDVAVRPSREGTPGRCDIDVTVAESNALPSLDTPLSRQNAALVRFANWITTEAQRGSVSIALRTSEVPEVRFVMTPGGETALYCQSDGDRSTFAVLAGARGIRLFGMDASGATGFDLAQFHAATAGFIYLFTDWPDGKSTRQANLTMGYGFLPTISTTRPNPRLIVSPTLACQYLVPDPVATFADGIVTIDHTAGVPMFLRFREDTGELLELRSVPMSDPRKPDPDPVLLSVSIGGNEYAGISHTVQQGWAQVPYDPSLRRALADVILASPLGRQLANSTRRRDFYRFLAAIRIGQRLLASPDVRLGLDDNDLTEAPPFEIAGDGGEPAIDVTTALAHMLYRVSRNLRPVQSWPSRLAREGSYVMRGDTRFTSAVLDDLHRDGDLGPMGSLLVAETLAAGDATQRGRFAARAAGLRSARGLETDYYNVMQRDAALARVIRFVLPALASLTEPEVAAVTEGMPAADATFVRGLVTTLRTTKLEDAASALRPVFDRWCQSRIEAAATPASAATAESKAAVH